ncbi:hypothetical protein [Acinetobacter seifertii]|uniref:hypothetical protein n=1 Tax=Acinetobacter seifertii TaxID=1530123 RepID=UPI001CCE910E|nr:hypothetical protein [Acinetobacter seifertii]MBZ6535080.1 hypothetical protein [Acinetobacter seifertii]
MSKLIVPVQVDYGAEEFFWYSPFDTVDQVISWWENQEHIDIYQKNIQDIIVGGSIKVIKTEEESTEFYTLCKKTVSIMIDNDYSSYLTYCGKKYFHKGKKYFN